MKLNVMWKIISIIFFLFFSKAIYGISAKSSVEINNEIIAIMKKYDINGVAIELYDQGNSSSFYFGYQSKDKKVKINENSIFELASITKVFTTLLIAEDILNHRINLNGPSADYLQLPLSNSQIFKKITIKNLATHTSSLPLNLPKFIINLPQALSYLSTWKPKYSIGNYYQYSNVGIGILGMVLEQVDKKSYQQLLNEKILHILEMKSTYLNLPENLKTNITEGYDKYGKPVQSIQGIFPEAYGLKSSPKDMRLFLRAALTLAGTPSEIKNAMILAQTAYVKLPEKSEGLGWEIHSLDSIQHDSTIDSSKNFLKYKPAKQIIENKTRFDGNVLIDKTGSSYGHRAYIALIPDKQTGIVILINKNVEDKIIVKIARDILFKLLER